MTWTIRRDDTATRARDVGTLPTIAEDGELTLSRLSAQLVIADHTHAPASMGGTGLGR